MVAVPTVPSDQMVTVSELAVISTVFRFVASLTEESHPGPERVTFRVPVTEVPVTVLVSEALLRMPNMYPTAENV